jgi:hypothetical protein
LTRRIVPDVNRPVSRDESRRTDRRVDNQQGLFGVFQRVAMFTVRIDHNQRRLLGLVDAAS